MNRFLLSAISVMLLGFVACENPAPQPAPAPVPTPPQPALTLLSADVVAVAAEGEVVTINYLLEHPDDHTLMVQTPQWASTLSSDDGRIQVSVAANEEDTSRDGLVEVSYADSSFSVRLEQAAAVREPDNGDVTFVAYDLSGYYYGEYYVEGQGNYFIVLSDKGFDEQGVSRPNATFYRFDAYAPLYEGDIVGERVPVPAATYTLDKANTYGDYTFATEYSGYWTTDADGNKSNIVEFDSGTLVVGADGITADLVVAGRRHTITFEGEPSLIDDSREYAEEVTYGTVSNLEGDYEPILDNHYLYVVDFGDYYDIGTPSWSIFILPYDNDGDIITFEILTSAGADGIDGDYTISEAYEDYTFLSGFYAGVMSGSGYITSDGSRYAAFLGGTLSLRTEADGTMSVEYRAYDVNSNIIRGSWRGEVSDIMIESSAPYSACSLRVPRN